MEVWKGKSFTPAPLGQNTDAADEEDDDDDEAEEGRDEHCLLAPSGREMIKRKFPSVPYVITYISITGGLLFAKQL